MRKISLVNPYRVRTGPLGSDDGLGNNGAFLIPVKGIFMQVIASDGMGWEHVSLCPMDQDRCPTWEEMCFIKDLFWEADECVVQFHPAQANYVNNHDYVLHLWRPVNQTLPTPPEILVGYKNLKPEQVKQAIEKLRHNPDRYKA